MRRIVLACVLAVCALPAYADDAEILRLNCHATDPAMSPPLSFSIDLTAKDAIETTTGTHYGVIAYRDGFGLFDPAIGPTGVVYRIDRVSGRFARVDRQLRWDGQCEKASPKL